MSDPRRVRAGQAVEEPDWFPRPITQPTPRRKYWPYVIAVAAVALFSVVTYWSRHV